MLRDAIAYYHDLLTDAVAGETQAQLDEQTELRDFRFGTRPVCSVLRPRLMSVSQYQILNLRLKPLLAAMNRAYEVALVNDEFRSQFGLTQAEDELLSIDPGFRHPSPTSRLDAFYVSERELKFTEFNTETPAGAAYHDVLTEMFLGFRVVREFLRRYQLRTLPARYGVMSGLLDAYSQWRGNTSTKPTIAIVDWREVPTYSEFRLFEEFFRSQGITVRIIDPREIEFDGKTLRVGNFSFDLIYKRVLIGELLERGGFNHPIIQAIRAGKVCMVNTFRCKILYKKASFAVLSDERNSHFFTTEQQQAIQDHIPWTRVVAERTTTYNGQSIDLIPYILADRERFVLKPNDEYGGKGIVLGWTVDATTWERAVQTALREPFVVQEKVNLPREVFPSVHDGKVHFIDRMLDTDPFIVHGTDFNGCLTRISTEALLNVTAGGGSTVPTFVVEER